MRVSLDSVTLVGSLIKCSNPMSVTKSVHEVFSVLFLSDRRSILKSPIKIIGLFSEYILLRSSSIHVSHSWIKLLSSSGGLYKVARSRHLFESLISIHIISMRLHSRSHLRLNGKPFLMYISTPPPSLWRLSLRTSPYPLILRKLSSTKLFRWLCAILLVRNVSFRQ